jgi:putative acetyltransferase
VIDASFTIRDGEDADSAAVIALIGAVFDEYPGCVLAVDEEMPELRGPASAFAARGGRFWVAEEGDDPEPRMSNRQVIGCVGLRPSADGAGVELCKLYVARAARRRGLGGALCGLVEAEAQARGAAFVELWTDTRFTDAHRLYERRGYARGPATRDLHDLSHTVEYFYRLDWE